MAGRVVGPKRYNGLELDERTGREGEREGSDLVARDGRRIRLGEKAAERKESFLEE
jgi:hypothetical protein